MISSLLRPLRGIVCVSSAGRAGLLRKSQIASCSPVRCTDLWGLGHKRWDEGRPARQPNRDPKPHMNIQLPISLEDFDRLVALAHEDQISPAEFVTRALHDAFGKR